MYRKLAVGALLALLMMPTAAGADATTRDRAGDVHAPGLRSEERAALDIVRVDARAKSPDALEATVRMRGNYERAGGSGRLRDSYVAVVLRPRTGEPTVVATTGAGSSEETLGGLGPGEAFATARRGRKVTFSVAGYPHEALKLSRVEVVTDGTLPTRRAGRASKLTEDVLALIESARDEDDPPADDEDLDWRPCRTLKRELKNLERAEAKLEQRRDRARRDGRRRAARKFQLALDEVEKRIEDVKRAIRAQCGPSSVPQPTPDPGLIVEAQADWVFFGSAPEVKVAVTANRPSDALVRGAASDQPVDAVRISAPSGRQITESFCSDPLTNRDTAENALTCSGGSLPLGQTYVAALQTNPHPEHGMGADVSVRQDGEFTQPVRAPGPARSCGFIFNPSIVLWQCSAAHEEVRFDFSRPVSKTSANDTCQLDPGDNSVIACPGSHGAFTSDGFTIDDPCPGTTFTAQTTFAPGDVQTFPEKACS